MGVMSSDARYVTTEETPATATANPDRQAGQDIARPRARSAASAISFPGLAYGEVAIARPALVGKVDTGTDPSVRARSDTRSTQPVSSLTAGTAGEEARDALADSAMWGLLRRTADAVSRVGQAAMAGVVGTRADATMEGLAKGLDCLTPTRSVIIYLGLIFVLTATALVPALHRRRDVEAAHSALSAAEEGLLFLKLALVSAACLGSLGFIGLCVVPSSRRLAMRFQGVISCALFDVSLVQGVLSFYIYKGHYDLATWFTAVGQPTPFAIGWTFLLATNPSLALVRQLHLAFAVAVLVATQLYVEVIAGGWSAVGVGRALVTGVVTVALSWVLETLVSARDSALSSVQRLQQIDAKDGAERAGLPHPLGRPPPRGSWRARMWEAAVHMWRRRPWVHVSDVDQFRVIFLLWWLLIVAVSCYSIDSTAKAIWHADGDIMDSAVEPTIALLTALLSFALGVRFARVLVVNREEVLANIVPVDVAQAIVQQHNMRGTRISGVHEKDPSVRGGRLPRKTTMEQAEGTQRGGLPTKTSLTTKTSMKGPQSKRFSAGAVESRSTKVLPSAREDRGLVEIVMPWQGVARDGLRPSRRLSVVAGHPLEPPPEEESLVFAEELTYYKEFEDISMVFSDLVGFTTFAQRVHPQTALMALHSIFSVLDKVVGTLKGHKYETVGDAYIGAFNMVRRDTNHALTAVIMGCTLVRVVSSTFVHCPGHESINLAARVGIHCGPAAGGVLGTKRSVLQLVGDTLNTASRMESHGIKNHVQVTEAVFRRLPEGVQRLFRAREVDVKGKGHMTTYVLDVLGEPEVAALGLDLLASRESWERVMREGDS